VFGSRRAFSYEREEKKLQNANGGRLSTFSHHHYLTGVHFWLLGGLIGQSVVVESGSLDFSAGRCLADRFGDAPFFTHKKNGV
jgi:hypothetical protein